ncbi:polysaccharide deacetylase family protein [Dendrosporobacter sp. 1207_IL3150]|uniref:polysaccharide deacetylase family protein n=1 Tax=Dendrosporobacter sp. 1207_IL3150 TaxID=3084054 RepID=UPI002FD8FE0E
MKSFPWVFWCVAVLFTITVIGINQNNLEEGLKVIKKVPTTQKVVALTIDDGPHERATPELLDTLRQKQVKVTLFVLGKNIERNASILAQAASDGHEIANHAFSHKFLNKFTPTEFAEEILATEKLITAVAPKPTLFRPPGGGYNDVLVAEARRLGYTTILWSIDTRDWQGISADQLVSIVMKNVKPGSIILMHDGQYPIATTKAIGTIIDRLHAEGYSIVTVSELLKCYEAKQ